MDATALHNSVNTLPPGRWAVGVSGGADSVALLFLLKSRPDLVLHVVHLDHETRNGQSGEDADFVRDLSNNIQLPCTIEKRSMIESNRGHSAKNVSDRYRRARHALFQKVVSDAQLQGIVLAHHADDQAETVLMRLLRCAAPENLAGMRAWSRINGMQIARPLLEIPRQQLREFLINLDQTWREDPSNQSNQYLRNRLRNLLSNQRSLRDTLLQLEVASRRVRDWLEITAPVLAESFHIDSMNKQPITLARYAAGKWLIARGAPPREIPGQTCERLIQMSRDAATPARQHFPGGLLVRRSKKIIFAEPASLRR